MELLGDDLGPYRPSVTKATIRRTLETNKNHKKEKKKELQNEEKQETRGSKRTWQEVKLHAPEYFSTSLE